MERKKTELDREVQRLESEAKAAEAKVAELTQRISHDESEITRMQQKIEEEAKKK